MLGNLTLYCVSNQARLFVPRQKESLKPVPLFFAQSDRDACQNALSKKALGPGRGGVWCKPEFALAATLGALVTRSRAQVSQEVPAGSASAGSRRTASRRSSIDSPKPPRFFGWWLLLRKSKGESASADALESLVSCDLCGTRPTEANTLEPTHSLACWCFAPLESLVSCCIFNPNRARSSWADKSGMRVNDRSNLACLTCSNATLVFLHILRERYQLY